MSKQVFIIFALFAVAVAGLSNPIRSQQKPATTPCGCEDDVSVTLGGPVKTVPVTEADPYDEKAVAADAAASRAGRHLHHGRTPRRRRSSKTCR